MKIKIQQEILQKSLDIVAGVVPAKTTISVLTCILLEADKDGLTLSATNLDISVVTKTDQATITGKGKIAIPASKFVTFVRSLSSGEVSIEEKSGKIVVRSGKAVLEAVSMNAEEYPKLPELVTDTSIEMESSILIELINQTSYAVSRDETRPALMGILWEIDPDGLKLVATDAHRLALAKRSFEWDNTLTKDMIIDSKGLRHLPRIVAGQEAPKEGPQTVSIFIGDNQLSFQANNTVLHTRMLEGPFPDYGAVIPTDNDKNLIVDRDTFAQAIRRVSITADRITSQIRLGIESERLELSATGTDGSSAEDEIPIAYNGDAIEIGFNFNYLQDILKNIQSDSVQLSVKDSKSAALVAPVGEDGVDENLVCLLMPLRLTSD